MLYFRFVYNILNQYWACLELNPGPLTPEARIIPLDQQAMKYFINHFKKLILWIILFPKLGIKNCKFGLDYTFFAKSNRYKKSCDKLYTICYIFVFFITY